MATTTAATKAVIAANTQNGGISASCWMATCTPPQFPAINGPVSADVCVVGAGIAGLTTAYMLTKKHVPVIVVDDGPILSGETQRTTAHLMTALDDRYYNIISMHGEDGAKLAYESHATAIDTIEKIVTEEKIECDFQRVDGHLFLGENDKESNLDRELDAAKRAGVVGVEKLAKLSINGKELGPCLRFPKQGQFHPTKYLSAVAKAIVAGGGNIFTNSHVTHVDDSQSSPTLNVTVAGGFTVTARRVIIATNAPIVDNALIYAKQAPYRSFVVGLRIKRDSFPSALLWDTADPYHYVRLMRGASGHSSATSSSNNDDDVLIVGGEDHKTGQANDMAARLDKLETWARTRLGVQGERLYAWSGQVQETVDGLAMVGKIPGHSDRTLIATGDSGMGMTHGTIAAMILSELATGGTHRWASLYDPARFKLASATEFIKENANVGVTLAQGWLKAGSGDATRVSELPVGGGAVVRNGMSHAAVYRDERGTLHCHSAVCTHKGGVVEWNDGEKTFDCPLHGSRFDALGRVLTAPACKDLEDLSEDDIRRLT